MALDMIAGLASSFVGSILVARVMGPTSLGYYNFVLWIAGLTGQFGAFGIPAATRKFAAELRGHGDLAGAGRVVAATARLQRILAVVVCLAGGGIVYATSSPQHRFYALLALISVGPTLLMSTYAAGLAAAEDFASQVGSSIAASVANLLGVSLTLIFHWGLVGLAGSLLLSRVVDFVIRRHLYIRRVKGEEGLEPPAELNPELRRRMIRFCAYCVGLLLLNAVVWDRSEVFFLQRFSDIKQVAFYSVGFNLVQQLIYLPRVLTGPASARIMVEFGQDRRMSGEIAEMTTRYLALFTFPAMLGMAALSNALVRVLWGAAYVPAIPVLAIASVFAVVRGILSPADQLLVAHERQNTMLKWSIVCAALNLTLDFTLIRAYGAIGAAVANGITQSVAGIGVWVMAVKLCDAKFPAAPAAKLLLASIIMAAGVAACSWTLPPALALGVGVPLGIALFVISMRLLRPFDARDLSRLTLIAKVMPGPAARLYRALLRFAIPTGPEKPETALATTA
jgi:O-antigen/teichoic acid export membrane protein